jgi:Flp pilus assembly protein TadB
MSTGLIIAIVVVAIVLIAVIAFVMPRARERARERELQRRREQVAGEHREIAEERSAEAEIAEQTARRERAEAALHEQRAEAAERGMADDELRHRESLAEPEREGSGRFARTPEEEKADRPTRPT